MDTINTMAASAAKAVWGESNKPSTEEPVSGRLGDTTRGEPYDAGNMEPISADTGKEALSDVPSDDEPNYTHTKSSNDEFTTERKSERETEPKSEREGKGESDITGDAKFAKNTGTAVADEDTPSNPSTERKAASIPADTSKGQGDTRSPEDPNTHPKSAPTDVNDAPAEDGINEPQQLEGPGPKPLAEVAKEHGGDAGNDSSSSVDSAKKSPDELSATGEEKHESEKGTGEKVIRVSGLQADGGDFDAAKAGAGQEADRLMEEKGLHNPANPNSNGADDTSPSSPTGKKSLGQKIKDKLHRH